MNIDRRQFTRSLALTAGALAAPSWTTKLLAAPVSPATALPRAAARLPSNRVTKIRIFYPPNYDPNGPQAFPQSNMVVLVDTDAGITGIGQGGSPDTVRNVARSVIGKNAFDTEMIWQAAFMDSFYSPGKERLHAIGAIDLALWDIKGKALASRSISCSAARRASTSSSTPRQVCRLVWCHRRKPGGGCH
jgi:galactonate dehydratase